MDKQNKRFDTQDFNKNIYEFEPGNEKVKYYRKVEKTITTTKSNINSGKSREYTTYINKSYSRGNDSKGAKKTDITTKYKKGKDENIEYEGRDEYGTNKYKKGNNESIRNEGKNGYGITNKYESKSYQSIKYEGGNKYGASNKYNSKSNNNEERKGYGNANKYERKNKYENESIKYERRTEYERTNKYDNGNDKNNVSKKIKEYGKSNKYEKNYRYENVNNKNDKNKQEKKVVKSLPKVISRVEHIVIQQKKEDTGEKQLVDNYQYHETKYIKNKNKNSVVTHKRLSEPFYSTVSNSSTKRYSSYTQQIRGYPTYSSMKREENKTIEPKRTLENASNQKINIRTQKIPEREKYNYSSSKQGSQSTKSYNYNTYQSNYGNKVDTYKRREVSEGKVNKPTVSNKYKSSYEKKYEGRTGNDYNNNYNNIKRYQNNVSNRDKTNIKNELKSQINEKSKYIPQVVKDKKTIERTNINIYKNNEHTTKNINISEEIQRKYGQKGIKQTKEIYGENRNYYYPSEEMQKNKEVYKGEEREKKKYISKNSTN